MRTARSDAEAVEGWVPPFDTEAPLWRSEAEPAPDPEQWASPLRAWTDPMPADLAELESGMLSGPDWEAEVADDHPLGQLPTYRRRPPEAEEEVTWEPEEEVTWEPEEEVTWEAEEGVVTQPIAKALGNRDWSFALRLAIQEDWRDESKLTNLIFFARHPDLGGRALDPKEPGDAKLAQEWVRIRDKEVWPAIQRAARNDALAVSGTLAAAGHREFWGEPGKRFKSLVLWAAQEVDVDPGLLAASLLAETSRSSYLTNASVSSYLIGTDDFYERRSALKSKVPAYNKVGWDRNQTPETHLNDARRNPREVQTIRFDSGRDALLASAVNLKYGEVRLREAAAGRREDFDRLPIETRFALTRIAFAAGPGGARQRLDRVFDGKDILVRKDLPLKPYQTERNATIRTAQALHLREWIFRLRANRPPEPEVDESEMLDEVEEEGLDLDFDLEPEFEDEASGEETESLFQAEVPNVPQTTLRARIDQYLGRAKAEYTLPGGARVRAWPQFRYAKAGGIDVAKTALRRILGKGFEKAYPKAIHNAVYGKPRPAQITAITQALIDGGELASVQASHPTSPPDQVVRELQRKFRVGIDCSGYVQLAFIFAFFGSDNDSTKVRKQVGLHERRGWERLSNLSAKHFTAVPVTGARTADLFVLKPRPGDTDRAWHTMLIVDHTVSGPEHTFLVDASWGTDLYGVEKGGVGRRKLVHDEASGEWWDIDPITLNIAHKNPVGPYAGHIVHGMFRPIQKP